MEKLIQLTNSDEFKQDWSLCITGISSKALEDHTILSLEAYYSGVETDREGEKNYLGKSLAMGLLLVVLTQVI